MAATKRRVSLDDLRDDYPTFARLALKIRNKKKQIVPLVLNPAQWVVEQAVLRQRRRGIPPRVIELKARQEGMSSDAEGRLFHLDWSIDGYESLVIAHKKDSAKKVFNMFRRFAHYMPPALNFSTRYATKTDMEFSNGSTMSVEVAGEGTGRGHTPPGVHLCFPAETPILIDNGREVRADAVRVGDRVLTHLGNEARVSAITSRPNTAPCVTIRPWLGRAITLTENHPVFTRRGWVPAGDLSMSDEVSMPVRGFERTITSATLSRGARDALGRRRRRTGSDETIEFDYGFGYFVGYYLAEGCVHFNRPGGKYLPSSIYMARDCDEGHYADRAWEAVKHLCSSRHPRRLKDSRTVTDVFYGAALAEWVAANFGILEEKRVPDWAWQSGDGFCRGLLFGYLAGDGSKTQQPYESVYATSVRSSLAYQMRDIAASLGYGWAAIDFKPAGLRAGRNERSAWIARWHGAAAKEMRATLGLPIHDGRRAASDRARLADGHAWMRIRSVAATTCAEVYDIEVDHPDHSFRTASFAIKNSEMAYYRNPGETLDAVMSGVPDTLDSLVVIESTAFGMNEFQTEWVRAKTGKSDFVPIFVPWYMDPGYRMPAHFGYDDCDEIERDMLQRYSLDLEQIAWRRWTIRNKCRGDVRIFQQEFPSDDRECFLVSGRPVFSSGAMDHYSRMVPPYADSRVIFRGDIVWDEKSETPKLVEWADGPLFIYRHPKDRCLYVNGADPSEGDPGSDPSPIVVVNRMTLAPDAVWYGRKRPDHLAETMRNLCVYYNRAHASWEANSHGLAFTIAFEKLWDDFYMRPTSEDSVNRGVSDKPGYNTNVKSRALGVDNLIAIINDQRVEIFDANMVEQICKFHYNAKNKPIAQEGAEDDLLMAYMVALAAHQVDPANALEPLTSDEVDHALSELQRKRVAASMGIEYELSVNRETITAEELEKLDEIADSRDARARAVTGRSL